MFLAAIKAGIVPIPTNPLLTQSGYEFILSDSRAKLLVVSEAPLGARSATSTSRDRPAPSCTGTTAIAPRRRSRGRGREAATSIISMKTYAHRSDDMLKVSGQYVSPFEIEAFLATHPDVLEAAVIGAEDENQLIKPKAYVVLKEGCSPCAELEDALKHHVKSMLSRYKYPRRIAFVGELPKIATGKIRRFTLREKSQSEASQSLQGAR